MTDLEQIAFALSDPLRIRILDLLTQARNQPRCSPTDPKMPGAICSCDLAPQLDDMAPSKLAYHLKILRQAEVVKHYRRGKWAYYTLNNAMIEGFALAVTERFSTHCPPLNLVGGPG